MRMEGNKEKVKLKSSRRELKKNKTPLLKPDVMLITKDVMVPLKLPPPPGKLFPISKKILKTRSRPEKALRVSYPEQNHLLTLRKCRETSPVGQIMPEKNIREEFPFHSISGYNEIRSHIHVDRTEDSSFISNSDPFHFNRKGRGNIASQRFSRVKESLPHSCRNSIGSILASSDGGENIPVLDYPRNSSENNIDSQNLVEEGIRCHNMEDAKSDRLENKFDPLNSLNVENSITEEQSDAPHDSNPEKLVIDCRVEQGYKDIAENHYDDSSVEWHRIMIDVEYLLQSLLKNLETLDGSDSFDKCKKASSIEKTTSQIFKIPEYNVNERVPTMIEFRHNSLHNLPDTVSPLDHSDRSNIERAGIRSERKYSWQELDPLDVNSNRSTEQIEVKYSWQIISQVDRGLNNQNESIINEKHSKLTSTEDLHPKEPSFQYSWQKLTSKYLTEENRTIDVDIFDDPNQSEHLTNNISKNVDCTENSEDYSSRKETPMQSSESIRNFWDDEKREAVENLGKIGTNSPLNNIISSMLPEIKLIRRRTSFNDTAAVIIGRGDYLGSSSLRNNSKKSCAPHCSVSSIKHVIANLNEMVTEQKHMLDAHVKNHDLDKNLDERDSPLYPALNTLKKVEIFPSTLHVLGNYIVRDIHPSDMNVQRNLLDASNNENLNIYSLSDKFSNEKSTRSNDSNSHSPNHLKDTDFSSMPSQSVSRGGDCYSTIFKNDTNFPRDTKNPDRSKPGYCTPEENGSSVLLPVIGYVRKLSEKNWEPAIEAMEEMMELSQEAARCMDEGRDDGIEPVPHTKNTGPLRPRVQVTFSETNNEAGDGRTRKEELLSRLESAMGRLKQSDEHVDANWNLDYSVLDIEESISDKKVQLPNEVEDHIKDIIKSAEEYLAKLEEQLNDLRNADDQIINSSERTFRDIDETYQLFMDTLCKEINKRRKLVRLETEVFKYEGLAPLRACKQEVDAQIRSTQHLIVLTENMLTHPITFNKERLGKIITATSHMGRIPAVPMPEELPYVTFSPPNEEMRKEIIDRISCLGCVLRMGPAQFTEVCERPAGLQLKWHVADPEYASEEQTFIVQKALGEIVEPTSSAFETVYIGSETSCFVRDLPVDHRITLRVGIQVTDTAWSVHRIAHTSIPAYSWDTSNPDYLITNGGRVATKVTQNLSTLLSRSPQFRANYIIEFKFLEAASGGDGEGIGLVLEPDGANETLKRNGALLITPNGNIFMNGEQKLMQLPKMELGTRIVFTSEPKDDETLRMTIECANKAVTYDWTVATPLHFAARFSKHNKWNMMVK